MKVSNILKSKGSDVITAQPHRTLHEIAHILADKGIGAVVITSADGALMGIISSAMWCAFSHAAAPKP